MEASDFKNKSEVDVDSNDGFTEIIYDAWFESWLLNHVPKLMKQAKWFDHERDLQVGDIVLFTKVESKLSKTYTYGIISNVETGDDGKVRCVNVKYQNENEKVHRETRRSVRNLVLIHSVDEFYFMKELGEIAKNVDLEYKVHIHIFKKTQNSDYDVVKDCLHLIVGG